MARDTLQSIQEDVQADLRETDSDTFDPERLGKFLKRALQDVSQRQGNPKRIYCTTTGEDKEIDVTEISHDIMRVNKVEFQVDSDTPEYRNAVWNGVNIVEFYTNTTPTRVAIASIADAGGGDITVVCSTVHGMAVGDYVTLT